MSPRRLAQAAERNNHEIYIVLKILDASHNEQEKIYELLLAWRDFPIGEATWKHYSVMADISASHGPGRRHCPRLDSRRPRRQKRRRSPPGRRHRPRVDSGRHRRD
jgi:hypothetical protein